MHKGINAADYSLWEVILNGDSPPPTRIVDGAVQIVAPTTAEQSTNESVNAAPSISAASSKAKVSTLPNVDSLSDAVIYSFFLKSQDLVFTDDPNASESVANVFNVESSINKPRKDMSKTHRPDAPIVEDWMSDSEDEIEIESVPKQREPSFVTSTDHVKNVVPTAVLTRSRLVSLNAARPVPTAVTQSIVKSLWPVKHGNPQQALKDKGVIDNGCSRHIAGNIFFLLDFEEIDGGYVAFRGNPKGGEIFGKGKIKTGKLDFDDVYFVKELKFNLFSVSQIRESNIEPLFCGMKGIKREFSVARTPQQNRVAERKNRTLIKAAKTMLADSLLLIPFWAEAVNTACYIQNRVLVIKLHKKTPYELLLGRSPSIGFMRPFGCPVTILNTLDPLGKFDGKADEGFLVGYSMNCKAFRVFNNPHNTYDDVADATFDVKENENDVHVSANGSDKTGNKKHDEKAKRYDKGKSPVDSPTGCTCTASGPNPTNSTNSFSTAGPSIIVVSPNFRIARKSSFVDPSKYPDDPDMPELEDIVYSDNEEDVGVEADLSPQTRSMTMMVKEQGGLHQINNEDFHTYLPKDKRAIGSKWVFRNKKDERGIVIKNKARLAWRHTQEEGIDYDEVFASVARIKPIWLFLAYAFFMGFMVYQMDVGNGYDKKGTKSKQNQTKPSTKWKAWKSQQSKPRWDYDPEKLWCCSGFTRRNRRRLKQPFILEESPVDTMADQRTMAELLHQFFGLEKENPHDHIRWGSLPMAKKRTLAFYSHLELSKLTYAVNQQTSAVTTAMMAILKQFQATPPPASVKTMEEICVTCGGAHPYYLCLATGGNTIPELRIIFKDTVGSLPSNTVANPKGKLKSITTRNGIFLDGPFVPTPPPFINLEVDKRVEETLTDQDLSEYTIKVPPPPVQKYKPPSQRDLLSVILKMLPKKLGDPGKFLILCGFNDLKCKALADLGASIILMPLSVWKKLGLTELISTRMTLELANRAICTPARIARDVFVPVGKFTFPVDFVIVDYESDPRVSLILGRPFLRTARALIDVHGE
nr:retrovirus-related Pol polyprotein from transposon TNT 1-94 [Tanacetum cinerariifolium]